MNHQARILVDAQDADRYALRVLLELEGFDVTMCVDGQAAIAAVTAEEIDLVLVDLSVPDLSGFELLQALTEAHPGGTLKLTSEAPEILRVRALGHGSRRLHAEIRAGASAVTPRGVRRSKTPDNNRREVRLRRPDAAARHAEHCAQRCRQARIFVPGKQLTLKSTPGGCTSPPTAGDVAPPSHWRRNDRHRNPRFAPG